MEDLAHDAVVNHHWKVRFQSGIRTLVNQNNPRGLARSSAEHLRGQRRKRNLLAQVKKHLQALAFRGLLSEALVLYSQCFEFALKGLILAARRPQIYIAVPHAADSPYRRVAGSLKGPNHVDNAAADQWDILIAAQLIGHQQKLPEKDRREDHQTAVAKRQTYLLLTEQIHCTAAPLRRQCSQILLRSFSSTCLTA